MLQIQSETVLDKVDGEENPNPIHPLFDVDVIGFKNIKNGLG